MRRRAQVLRTSNTPIAQPRSPMELSRVLKRSSRLDALDRMGFSTVHGVGDEIPLEGVKKPNRLPEELLKREEE